MSTQPRAFVSFDFDNNAPSKLYFAGQCTEKSPTPFTVADWSSKSSLPQAVWEAQIAEKIGKCNMLIVLVGRSMSSASGVAKEIQFAKDANVPYFGVYVDNANTTSTLPTDISRKNVVAWEWKKIADMIDQCMKMGKNA